MSLEQTIADLVAASNKLTGTINSKMNEIDQKVDEATQAVPDTVREMSEVEFYVDAVNGDDANDGRSKSEPLKTVLEVAKRVFHGTSVSIVLRESQVHETVRHNLHFRNNTVRFSAWYDPGNDKDNSDMPTLRMVADLDGDGLSNSGGAFVIDTTVVFFFGIKIVCEKESNGVKIHTYNGLFRSHSADIKVFFVDSKLELVDRPVFNSLWPGRVSAFVGVAYTDVSKVRRDQDLTEDFCYIFLHEGLFSFGAMSSTIGADETWQDYVNFDLDNPRAQMTNLPVHTWTA